MKTTTHIATKCIDGRFQYSTKDYCLTLEAAKNRKAAQVIIEVSEHHIPSMTAQHIQTLALPMMTKLELLDLADALKAAALQMKTDSLFCK